MGIYAEVTGRRAHDFELAALGDFVRAVEKILDAAGDAAYPVKAEAFDDALRHARSFADQLERDEQRSTELCMIALVQFRLQRVHDAMRTLNDIGVGRGTSLALVAREVEWRPDDPLLPDFIAACADYPVSAQAAAALLAMFDEAQAADVVRAMLEVE